MYNRSLTFPAEFGEIFVRQSYEIFISVFSLLSKISPIQVSYYVQFCIVGSPTDAIMTAVNEELMK